jgi:hypothetical protein
MKANMEMAAKAKGIVPVGQPKVAPPVSSSNPVQGWNKLQTQNSLYSHVNSSFNQPLKRNLTSRKIVTPRKSTTVANISKDQGQSTSKNQDFQRKKSI